MRKIVVNREQMVQRMINERGGHLCLALRQEFMQLFDAQVCVSAAIRYVAERFKRLPACVQESTLPSSGHPARKLFASMRFPPVA